MSATTVSTSTPVVSITTASSAARSGDTARPRSSASRRSSAALHVVDRDLRAPRRLVALAAPGPLVVARGQEHLDASRPGTRPCRCRGPRPLPRRGARPTRAGCATSTSRTAGCADTVDTAAVTSGPRISALTSRPSRRRHARPRARSPLRGQRPRTPRRRRSHRRARAPRASPRGTSRRCRAPAARARPRRRARRSTSPSPTARRSRRTTVIDVR